MPKPRKPREMPSRNTVLLGVMLAGCSVVNPQIDQLGQMERNAQAGKYVDNAAQSISCGSDRDTCMRLHLLKGDACYRLAKGAGADQRAQAQCAASELGQGLDLATAETGPDGPRRVYAADQLDALSMMIDTRRRGDPPGTAELAAAAAAFRTRYPDDPAGPFYTAMSGLAAAQDRYNATGDKAALCKALSPVDSARAAGAAAPGTLVDNYRALAGSIAGMRRVGACT
jgi:hypothetical protein